jgi:hypothetical protein
MRLGTHSLIRDSAVGGTPNCEHCDQPLQYIPNESRTGIGFVDEYHINGNVRGWWVCWDCVTCRSCQRTLRKNQECDCWQCPCCKAVPGARVRIAPHAVRKGEPCSVCGCHEGQCVCKFQCRICGVRHKTVICGRAAESAAFLGVSVEAYEEMVLAEWAARGGRPLPI